MQGVEISHCNAAIRAVLAAYNSVLGSTVEEALRPILAYGKSDTLGLDAMPEITLVERLEQYDKYAIVITEECGSRESSHFTNTDDPRRFRTIFIADPTDRSDQLQKLLEGVTDRTKKVGEVLRDSESRKSWAEEFGAPVEITGSTSAITCLRRGVPIFSVILNYITQQLVVSCSAGIYVLAIPEELVNIDLDFVRDRGRRLTFPSINALKTSDMRRFVTFMGSAGKKGYQENLQDSKLMSSAEQEEFLHYRSPGGPSRTLYLSDLQPKETPIGFVLANGEKIGEWIHWLPFVRFAKKSEDESLPALRLFEIYQDRPWTKEGILMSTPPAYSIFKPIGKDGDAVIDVSRFSAFPNPSRMRSTLLVTPCDNQWATRVVNQYGYRPLILGDERE